jgi:hypothetical protein
MAGNAALPAFFWYPEGKSTLELLVCPEAVSSILAWPETAAEDAIGLTGKQHRVSTYTRYRVRIEFERVPGTSAAGQLFVRELHAMIAHLQRGHSVGFTGQQNNGYMYFSTITPAAGATFIKVPLLGSPIRFWNASASPALAANDEIWIQSAPPESLYELNTVEGLTSLSQIEVGAIVQKFGTRVCIRHRDFWPALRMPAESVRTPVLTHTKRLGYTLDMTLVEDAETMFSWQDQTLVGTDAHIGRLTADEVAARSVSPVRVTPRGPRSGTTKR